jgi:hypothetical protein
MVGVWSLRILQHFGWLASIHCLRNGRDLKDPFHGVVRSSTHQINNHRELVEVFPFRGSQAVLLKERNNHFAQVHQPSNSVSAHIVSVIIIAPIDGYAAATEIALQPFQNISTSSGLDDREFRLYLPPERRLSVSKDGTAETALPIYEAGNPPTVPESFLLIFRTQCIVTAAHTSTLQLSCNDDNERRVALGYSVFPAFGRLLSTLSPMWRATPLCLLRDIPYLRTVIVTAAVYRGLGSELRPKANPSP